MKYLMKTTLLVFFLASSQLSIAQSLLRYIPSDATMVMSLDPVHLNQKVSIEKLEQLEVYKMMVGMLTNEAGSRKDLMQQIIDDPKTIGLDFKKSASYASFSIGANNSMSAQLVMKVSDATKFEEFFNKQINNRGRIPLQKTGNMTYAIQGSNMAVAWDKEKLIVYGGEMSPEKEESYKDFRARKDQAFKDNFMSLLSMSPTKSILKNVSFMRSQGKGNDAHLWMDYGPLMEMSQGMLAGGMPGMADSPVPLELVQSMYSLYDDMKVSASMNFEKGAMVMNGKTFMGKKLMDFSKKAYKRKLNRNFYKYIKQDGLMAYFSLATDSKAMWEGMKDIVYPMIEKAGEEGEMAVSALKVMEIAIDEDALYDLLKGDVVFAVTGLREFETSYQSFEYDKDFNKKEVTKTRKNNLPEFVMMLSYGEEDNINKFLRLGQQAKVIEPIKRNAYRFNNLPSEMTMGMDLYFGMNKGVMILTNDASLVNQYLESGLPSTQRISGADKKRLKKNVSTLYWNVPETLQHLPENLVGDQSVQQVVNMSKNSLKNFEMTFKRPKKGYMEQDVRFNFFNEEVNGLEQLMNYINDVYLTATDEKKSM